MTILRLKSGETAKGMLAYCYENKKGQADDIERCTEFINSYGFDNYEDVSHAWTMERQGCGKEKGRQYYHATLSIDPADPRAASLTNQEIADMGETFVKDFAPDHAYAVFVHRDEKHPHVHVLWNSVNLETGKKFQISNADLERSKVIKEQIDLKFGINPTPSKKAEGQQDRIAPEVLRIIERTNDAYIWTEDLKNRITEVSIQSENISDFTSRIKAVGVDITERGSENKFTYSFVDKNGKQRKVRQDKLGEIYGRESLSTAIEQHIEREFRQGQAAQQLSIKYISDLSAPESGGVRVLYTRGERPHIEDTNVRPLEISVREGDESTRTDSFNTGIPFVKDGLSEFLPGGDKASVLRRSSEDEYKPYDSSVEFEQKHSGTDIESLSIAKLSSIGGSSEHSEDSEEARRSRRDSYTFVEGNGRKNNIHMPEYRGDGQDGEWLGSGNKARIRQDTEQESPYSHAEDSFLRRDGSDNFHFGLPRSIPTEAGGFPGNSRQPNHPRLLSERVTDSLPITDQVKEITLKIIEHIKEWREGFDGISKDKFDRSGDGFNQHKEQGRNPSLYEGMQKELSGSDYFTREDASKRMSSVTSNSSDRISQCARDSSERIAEYERDSSKSHISSERSTGKSLKHSIDNSSERTREYERDLRGRNEETIRELQKSVRDLTEKCHGIGKHVEARKQEEIKKAKEKAMAVKSRGYDMER